MKLIFGPWVAFCKFIDYHQNYFRQKKCSIFFLHISYTLLVGRPPFETQSLKDTYSKIKRNEYHIPSRIGPLARALITRMLQGDPCTR